MTEVQTKTILDKFYENLTQSMELEGLGISPKIATLNSASSRTDFQFFLNLSDDLRVSFAGIVETYRSNGKWIVNENKAHQASIRANVQVSLSDNHREFAHYNSPDFYDRGFLEYRGAMLPNLEDELAYFNRNPHDLFDMHSIMGFEKSDEVNLYIDWLSEQLDAGTHDLGKVRVIYGEEVFDGHGELMGLTSSFYLGNNEGLINRFSAETMHEMVEAEIFHRTNSPSGQMTEKLKASMKRRIDAPGAHKFNVQVALSHDLDDVKAALAKINLTSLEPFVPISITDQGTYFNDALLDIVMERHGIKPQYTEKYLGTHGG